MAAGFREKLASGFLDSGNKKNTAAIISKMMATKTAKMVLHPKCAVMNPPSVGAIMGDTATTNMRVENTLALSFTSNKSLTIALAATIPTQPPNA